MTKDEKLDEFMKRIGIELSPFQKEIIKKIADENKIYMCYPPHVGRYESLRLIQALANVFEKGDYSGPLAHPGRSLAQLDRASAHSTRSAVQPMLAADQHTC